MKAFLNLIFIFLSLNGFGQIDTVAPPPPPPPVPQTQLSEEEIAELKRLERKVNNLRNNNIGLLDTLKRIAFDKQVFYVYRVRAIRLISELASPEAFYFLYDKIDMFIEDPLATNPYRPENYPCFMTLQDMEHYGVADYLLGDDGFLSKECWEPLRLDYYLVLLRRAFNDEVVSTLLEKGGRVKNKCYIKNSAYMLEKLQRK